MPPRASVGFLKNEGTYVTKQSQTDWIYANCAECNVRKNTHYRQKQSKQFFIALGSIFNTTKRCDSWWTIMDFFFFFGVWRNQERTDGLFFLRASADYKNDILIPPENNADKRISPMHCLRVIQLCFENLSDVSPEFEIL